MAINTATPAFSSRFFNRPWADEISVGTPPGCRFLNRMPALRPSLLRASLGLAVFMVFMGSALATVNRVFTLTLPATVPAGSKVDVVVRMSTDAGEGEAIAFLQAEYSIDGGRTWTGSWAEQDLGTRADRGFSFTAGAAGTECRVRARVAYRGGVAGAVDCAGAAIRWFDTWKNWREPPAKSATISVR